eukprot:TRINITY_DN7768_c0_g3_i4.p2 TRINITY_DN7768_c0_g3~~TRINITY_DN7768_c0_g3_i4.p2  ORF type:complete len:135 (-),score=25.08 TRINITY_DN7768_c0_g3_i4:196-600(-)
MTEAARIVRGNVKEMGSLDAKEYDAVVVPGGFGVAKNFCDFAVKGPDCTVDPKVEKVLKQFHELKKPIGLCCIAPVLAAKLFGSKGVEITLGKEGDEWPHSGTISTSLHKPNRGLRIVRQQSKAAGRARALRGH